MIKPTTLTFLRKLAKNNDREWFNANRRTYEAARDNVADFAQSVLERLSETDVLETPNGRKALFRINRDVRFSKDKSPYKTNLSGQFKRDGQRRRGGYYFSIHPGGKTFIGGGFYAPESKDLKRIREELAADGSEMRAIMADPDLQRIYGGLRGEKLKTAPQGYPRDHPNIDLLNHKQWYAGVEIPDKEVTQTDFADRTVEAFLALRPFFDYFSEALTTDANGELIV